MSDDLEVAYVPEMTAPPVPGRYYCSLTAATSTSWALILGPALTTLPSQVEVLSGSGRVSALALVTGVGGAVGIMSIPIIGRLSDVTQSRWGKRKPWIAAGAVLVIPAALTTATAATLIQLAVSWSVLQIVINMLLAPVMATIPEIVPERRRGAASACLAISGALAPILGTAVDVLAGDTIRAYLTLAVLAVASHAVLLSTLRCNGFCDTGADELSFTERPPQNPGLGFALAWLLRFLFALGQNLSVPFLYFYLQDVVHYPQNHSGGTNAGVLTTTAIYGPCVIVAAIVAGIVCDRTHRYKVYIVSATALFATGVWLAAWTSDWNGVLVLSALTGLGFGAYEATSMALVMRLLPNPQRRARDLSVINAATLIAIAIGPVVASPVITGFGYAMTYFVSGLTVLASGIVALCIRGTR